MIFFLLAELFFLYLLSRAVQQGIYRLVYLVTKSRTFPITVLSLLFFPGTVIHELAHWFVAELLRVPTGEITLHPVIDKKSGGVKMGSVKIVQTDPIRRVIIGLAPVFVGITVIAATTHLYVSTVSSPPTIRLGTSETWLSLRFHTLNLPPLRWLSFPVTYLFLYLLSSIGNTMFSSKKDLEGFLLVSFVISLFAISLHKADLWPQIPQVQILLSKVSALLFPAITVLVFSDIIIILFIHLGIKSGEEILKRKLFEV